MPIVVLFLAVVVAFLVLGAVLSALWWVVTTAVVGLVIGALARLVIPGRQRIGALATIVCGWAGALIGSAIGRGVWGYHHRLFTLLIEIGVAAVGVAAWSGHDRRSVRGRRQHHVIDV
jgi:uncharacterized membrane protein YeaQ/YmgE (transglycosylase-associated protein family)